MQQQLHECCTGHQDAYRLCALLNGVSWDEGGTDLLCDASRLTILHTTPQQEAHTQEHRVNIPSSAAKLPARTCVGTTITQYSQCLVAMIIGYDS
jgi:hypothetical protein